MHRRYGFSLFEAMLSITLLSITTAMAVPYFASLTARSQQRVEIDALFHAIHLARKESIVRRKVVSLCPSQDGATCAASREWSSGWLMFENTDRDSPPMIDPGEAVLRQHLASPNVRIVANRRGFTLRATFLRATNGTLVFCDRYGRTPSKALVVSYTGRPRVADHTQNGDLYSCTD